MPKGLKCRKGTQKDCIMQQWKKAWYYPGQAIIIYGHGSMHNILYTRITSTTNSCKGGSKGAHNNVLYNTHTTKVFLHSEVFEKQSSIIFCNTFIKEMLLFQSNL